MGTPPGFVGPAQETRTDRPASPAVYYPLFDWLRAVLAMVVMLGHDGLVPWSKSGAFAVDIFFALSGWLIGGLLLRQTRGGLPRFYFNRAVRIWVPYYIAVGLLLGASLLREPVTWKWAEFATYDALMVWNVFGTRQLAESRDAMPLKGTGNHFWSVNAEEQFYLLSPALLVLAPVWGRSRLVWAALAGAAWVCQVYAAIAFGVLAAVVAVRWDFTRVVAARRLALVAALGGAAGLALGGSYPLLAPVCAIGIVIALAAEGPATRLGTVAGGMSYPLYLNHWIGVFFANALFGPFGLRDSVPRHLVAIVFNLALAVGLYLCVDRWLLARRSAWFSPRRGRALTLLAYGMVLAGVLVGIGLWRV